MRPIITKAAPLFALTAALTLTACGTRGSLTQLPVPAQPPILERWVPPDPAKPTQKKEIPEQQQGAGDLNTPQEAQK